jgi:hypothetical protein
VLSADPLAKRPSLSKLTLKTRLLCPLKVLNPLFHGHRNDEFFKYFFSQSILTRLESSSEKKKKNFTDGIVRGEMFHRWHIEKKKETEKNICAMDGTLRIMYIIFSMYTV